MPKAVKFLQILFKSIHKAPDIFMCQPSKYCKVVQEEISGLNSLLSVSNLAQRRSSGVANCWFKCVGVFLSRS